MQPILEVIAENIRFYRKQAGLSQLKLAYQLEMSPSYLGEVERARQYPSIKVIERFANFFQIEPYRLLYPLSTNQKSELNAEYTQCIRNLQNQINLLFDNSLSQSNHNSL